MRQNWGYKNWTYQRKCVTEDGGFPYKGGGSIPFCPFSLSWYWRLLDIEWNRKILRSNKSPVTGVKIMAGQQTCPAKFYFFSNQNVSFIEMTVIFPLKQLEKSLLEIPGRHWKEWEQQQEMLSFFTVDNPIAAFCSVHFQLHWSLLFWLISNLEIRSNFHIYIELMLTSYLQSTSRIRTFAYENPLYYKLVRSCIHICLNVLPTKQIQ